MSHWTDYHINKLINEFLNKYAIVQFQPDFSFGYVIFFPETKNEIKILPDFVSKEQAKEIRDKLQTIYIFLKKISINRINDFARAIEKTKIRWMNYIFNGFSQYPWEVTLNEYLVSYSIQYPPKYQYIFFHPELSFEIKIDNLQSELEVLTVELLGILYYQNNWKNFFGFSFVLNMRNDLGAGIGGLFHYNMYSIGVVWHDIDDDGNKFDDPPFLTVGFDLYKLFESKKAKLDRLNRFIKKLH